MEYKGIKGLKGYDPIGCVVSIGIKSSRDFPTETDRFHIINAREENGIRYPHPAFTSFNKAAPEYRKIIRGNIVHALKENCFESYLKAQVINKPAHPNMKPQCIGDGVKATRWAGSDADDFKEIKCLHDLCEFRQKKPPLCKPWLRFLFRLRWKDDSTLPSMLAKFTSGSWNTTANMKGFFDYIDSAANQLGLENYTLFGLPFTMTLAYQTKASEKTKFPVVTISPEIDPVEFFMKQRAQIKEMVEYTPILITDKSEQNDEIVFEDVNQISLGNAIKHKS